MECQNHLVSTKSDCTARTTPRHNSAQEAQCSEYSFCTRNLPSSAYFTGPFTRAMKISWDWMITSLGGRLTALIPAFAAAMPAAGNSAPRASQRSLPARTMWGICGHLGRDHRSAADVLSLYFYFLFVFGCLCCSARKNS
ncbi:hypothetical protein K438DRAFT_1865227 [Mycena galopus ATCC 62051]|nr:hypothetical protein K438DRAFT_1865227 [Mycena galopus ATCC 62051]